MKYFLLTILILFTTTSIAQPTIDGTLMVKMYGEPHLQVAMETLVGIVPR